MTDLTLLSGKEFSDPTTEENVYDLIEYVQMIDELVENYSGVLSLATMIAKLVVKIGTEK